MKIPGKYLMLFILSGAVLLSGCKKKEDENVEIEEPTGITGFGSNDETARNEYDASVDEVFNTLQNTGLRTGRSSGDVVLPCGVVRIDSVGGVYKFVYGNVTPCGTKKLSGSISASLTNGTAWNQVGAELTLTFTDYEVLFVTNNQVLTFNGPITITNKDGGWLYEVILSGKTITHTIHGTINITFDKTDVRAWTISKKRIFASKDATWANLTLTLAADGPYAEQGTNKDGYPFLTTIPDPLIYTNCSTNGQELGPYIATSGKLVYDVSPNSMTAEAGYKYDKGSIVKVNDCTADGYKLTYDISGRQTIKFQYY